MAGAWVRTENATQILRNHFPRDRLPITGQGGSQPEMDPPRFMRGAAAPAAAEGRHADLKKLNANLKAAEAKDPIFEKPRVVLVSTGSFSPLHRYVDA